MFALILATCIQLVHYDCVLLHVEMLRSLDVEGTLQVVPQDGSGQSKFLNEVEVLTEEYVAVALVVVVCPLQSLHVLRLLLCLLLDLPALDDNAL